jgi:enoyl-CoA hydratase/carnithine racemase
MGYTTITMEIKDFIACITLNRPPTNSINLGMREDLHAAFTAIENDPNVRVVILTGAGEKGFSSGMDVTDVANLYNGPDAIDLYNRIDRFPKPVIAMINGYALGGGCELALTCHFRFMTDAPKAVIGCPEVNLGITPGWGGIQRLARLLGRPRALELILFSKRLSAQEALVIGLVDRVFPAGELVSGTMQFAQDLAKRAPLAVSSILKGMITGIEKGIDEGIKVDRECTKMLAQSEDAKEGFVAYMQKREPVFKGK